MTRFRDVRREVSGASGQKKYQELRYMKRIMTVGAALLLFFLWACATDSGVIPPGGLSFGSGDSQRGSGDTDSADSGNSRSGAEADSWTLAGARQAAAGLYKGIMPYPNSKGLETVIRLREDGSYMLRSRVVGKVEGTSELQGSFDINREGIVRLDKSAVDTVSPLYALDQSTDPPTLTQLDNQGQVLAGDSAGGYVLKKFPQAITETYWKLVRLSGSPVIWTGDRKREPHIILKLEGARVLGHSGTNSFSGTYTVKDGGGISFSQMRSTMIASPNMKIEMELYKALDTADSYTINENGFTIGVKGREPAAVFEAVYLY